MKHKPLSEERKAEREYWRGRTKRVFWSNAIFDETWLEFKTMYPGAVLRKALCEAFVWFYREHVKKRGKV